MGGLAEGCFAVADLAFGFGPVAVREIPGFTQVFAKAEDGLFPAAVLLIATALVVDIGGIVSLDEEVGEDIRALLVVPQGTGFLSCLFLGAR